MNSEPQNRDRHPQDDLHRLAAGACDGTISAAELARLEAILLADADSRAFYVRYIDLHARLGEPRAAVNGLPATESLSPEAPPAGQTPVKSPVLGFLGNVVDYVNHSRRLMFLLVAVMLCGWFVFQIGSVLIGRWLAGDRQVADQGDDHPSGPGRKPSDGGLADGTDRSHGNALAWLSGSVGGRWQIVALQPAAIDAGTIDRGTIDRGAGNSAGGVYWDIGTEFSAGQQVNLVAGIGEITFRSGAKVIVSAPAKFSVTSALVADLQLGKLSARVPHDSSHPGATGFTVNTPDGSVVDLGTEFGVEVTPDHKLDVQVFVGEVKVNAPSEGAAPSNAGDPGTHVTAGHAIHLEPGHPPAVVESQEKDKSRFQRDLTIASDSGDKALAAYLEFMRQLKPVVWLRMEGKEGDKTIHDEMGNPDGKLQWDGAGNAFVEGRLGKGLWIRGPQLKDYAILPDYPKAEHGKLSVSAWVIADSRPDNATIVGNWGDGTGQFQFGLYTSGSTRGRSFDLRVAMLLKDGQCLNFHEGESHLFPLNEWVHVAFVVDDSMLRLYRDGREVAATKHVGLKYPVEKKELGIGLCTNKAGNGPCPTIPPGFWSGKIDELAIFNDALTPVQIKKLATAPPR